MPVGNRLSLTTTVGVVNYQYDDANRLVMVGDVPVGWDNNGNMTSFGSQTYTYDHANRLTQVVSGTLTTGFTYNGAGDRVSRTVDGVTTDYVLDPAAGLTQVLQETTNSQTTSYLYGHDLLAQYDSGTWAYHVNDGLGSVRQLADPQGEVVQGYSFSPFGVPLGASGGEPYGFTGEQWDVEVALLYLRARMYAPKIGIFLTRDPVMEDAPYLYAGGNPIRFVDPTGEIYLPGWDAYSCDHRGGPDPRDPHISCYPPFRLSNGELAAVSGGYDYRGVPCIVYPENFPEWQPGMGVWGGPRGPYRLYTVSEPPDRREAAFQAAMRWARGNYKVEYLFNSWYYYESADFTYWDSQQVALALVRDWFYERGSAFRVHGPFAAMTRDLRQDEGVERAREEFCRGGQRDLEGWRYGFGHPSQPIREARQWFEGADRTGIGSVAGGYGVRILNNQNGTATVIVDNKTGRESGTRLLGRAPRIEEGWPRGIKDDPESWRDYVPISICVDKTREQTRPDETGVCPRWPIAPWLEPGPSGWGGDLEQRYAWTEPISCDCY